MDYQYVLIAMLLKAARDDEDIERIKFYEQKVTLVESKCAADIKTLQDYFDELGLWLILYNITDLFMHEQSVKLICQTLS